MATIKLNDLLSSKTEAYRAGFDAFRCGERVSSNPIPRGSPDNQYSQWITGWFDAKFSKKYGLDYLMIEADPTNKQK